MLRSPGSGRRYLRIPWRWTRDHAVDVLLDAEIPVEALMFNRGEIDPEFSAASDTTRGYQLEEPVTGKKRQIPRRWGSRCQESTQWDRKEQPRGAPPGSSG